jgi:hypothetical protein
MTIKVIGAGVGRTGTYSLKLALEHLGYGPCHHMEEVAKAPERQVPLWTAAFRGEPDFEAAYAGFNSAVDWPTAAFWRELADAYPEAKFVLTMRSAESWCDSYSQTINALLSRPEEARPEATPWFEMALSVIARSGFDTRMSRAELMTVFEARNAAVQSALPSSRLLVYEVREGWEPLCAFLDKAPPVTPFPRSNNRQEFWDLARLVTR